MGQELRQMATHLGYAVWNLLYAKGSVARELWYLRADAKRLYLPTVGTFRLDYSTWPKNSPVNVAELSLHLLNSTNHPELRANSSEGKSSLALSHNDVQPHFVIK